MEIDVVGYLIALCLILLVGWPYMFLLGLGKGKKKCELRLVRAFQHSKATLEQTIMLLCILRGKLPDSEEVSLLKLLKSGGMNIKEISKNWQTE